MLRIRVLLAAALATLVVCVAASTAEGNARRQMVRAINYVRSWNHRGHVRFSGALARGAAAWARHLVASNTLAHDYAAVARGQGEIIEWHTGARSRVRRTVSEWMHSAEHRTVMLTRGYHRAGAGRAVGYMGGRRCTIWVVRFAA